MVQRRDFERVDKYVYEVPQSYREDMGPRRAFMPTPS